MSNQPEKQVNFLKTFLLSVLFCLLAGPAFAAIAEVAGQAQGEYTNNGTTTLANLTFASNITAGNTILIIVLGYYGGGPVINTPTKASGTATLGTITLDTSYTDTVDGALEINVYHAYVTGTGSCTIAMTGTFNNNGSTAAIDEFSGMAQSNPVYGPPVVSSGSGSGAENPGSILTPSGGMALMVADQDSSSNFTWSYTNTIIYQEGQDAVDLSGIAQYSLTATGGAQTLTATPSAGVNYGAVGVAYRPASFTPSSSVTGHSTIAGNSVIN
jgi:hypothetical protein